MQRHDATAATTPLSGPTMGMVGPTMGMVGLGRMGANIVRRVVLAGGTAVVCDADPALATALANELGVAVTAVPGPADLAAALPSPRHVWVMVPAEATATVIDEVTGHMEPGDLLIDGGNTDWRTDAARAERLAERGIEFLDVGTSGGVWGLERGYSLMVGGNTEAVARVEAWFDALSPATDSVERTPGRHGDLEGAERGWLHCGPSGAGHFVKMVHNGIEYGMMAAYAEGLNLLQSGSDAGFDIDLAQVTEVWRRGSVVSSWLLDLTAAALAVDPHLEGFAGSVSDSGEGRWALETATELGVPAPVLAAALFSRFASRDEDLTANKALSAMRMQFGGHLEPPPPEDPPI